MHVTLLKFDREPRGGHEVVVIVQDDKAVVRGGRADHEVDSRQHLMGTTLSGP